MQTHFKAILAAIFTTISISILPMQPQPNGSDPEQKRLAAEFQCVMSSSGQNNVGGSAQNGVSGMEPGQYCPKLADLGDAYQRQLAINVGMHHLSGNPLGQTNPASSQANNGEIPFPECDTEPLDPDLAKSVLHNNTEIREIGNLLKKLPPTCEYCPNKLMMVGLPGTGKTVLAKAIAFEANIPLYRYVSSAIGNHWQKSANINIERIFKRHSNERCVLIFDELQELINKNGVANDSESTALSTLWTQLDKRIKGKIYFVGVLNHTDKVPEQIRSRFEQRILEVQLPTFGQRESIIAFYMNRAANDFIFEKEISAKIFAEKTEGFSCRSISELMEKAYELAIREYVKMDKVNHKPIITLSHFAPGFKNAQKAGKKLEPKEPYGAWFSRKLSDAGSIALHALISAVVDKGVDSARTAIYNKYHGIDPVQDYKDRREREADAYAADKEKREKDKDLFELDIATRMAYIEQMGANHAALEAAKLVEKMQAKYKLP